MTVPLGLTPRTWDEVSEEGKQDNPKKTEGVYKEAYDPGETVEEGDRDLRMAPTDA